MLGTYESACTLWREACRSYFARRRARTTVPSALSGDLQGAVVEALDIRGAVNVAGLEVDHPSYRNTERLVLAAIPELVYHQECVALANIADMFPQVRSLGLSSALAASCFGSYTS